MKGVDGKKDNKLYCENKTDSELIFVGLLLQRRKPRVLCHSIYTGHKTRGLRRWIHFCLCIKSTRINHVFLLIAKLLMQKYNKGRYLLSNERSLL